MAFVRNRVPALSHEPNVIARRTLKSLFLTDVERLAGEGYFKGTKRIALRAFIDMMGPDCALYPSHAAVAQKAGLSERTVWAALNEAEGLGLLRVTPRYVYDAEKGKRVRTSNLYEVAVTMAQKAAAIVAAAARKAHEAAKREAAATSRAFRGLFHHLTATDAENPPKDILKKGERVRHDPQMSRLDMIQWCLRGS
ncbi:hypothetical protein [Komagataeibacter europaeus]|uniref:hypothetical protein n=1 Tax=Komagataeibacter europaeus TaxID=33995 RepID=UPI0015962AD8|nr:hypothetical protein [Komagataeibacter europaeus]GBQ41157.1 hypothetical protein AA18890_1042 [Komagataeibacter europaeus LMG 18890]